MSRVVLVMYIAVVAVLCFANFNDVPQVEKTIFGIATDKVVHFCMFFPLPIFSFMAFGRNLGTVGKFLVRLVYIVCFCCIFAGITEIIQGTLPYRSQDIHDFYADCIAIAFGTLIVLIFELFSLRRSK